MSDRIEYVVQSATGMADGKVTDWFDTEYKFEFKFDHTSGSRSERVAWMAAVGAMKYLDYLDEDEDYHWPSRIVRRTAAEKEMLRSEQRGEQGG